MWLFRSGAIVFYDTLTKVAMVHINNKWGCNYYEVISADGLWITINSSTIAINYVKFIL